MESLAFLQDLAVVMIVAGLVTLVCHRLKQPVVLGYILAGFIIGPHTPPFPLIHDEATIDTMAQLGIILLMFSLGLEFNLRKLSQVGAPALVAALSEFFLLFWAGYQIGRYFDWSTMNCVFLGAMLSMSSTTIIIKVLGELDKMNERFAHLIFGILIIEDILGIAMIALLSGLALTGSVSVLEVGVTLAKLGIFMAVILVVGLLTVPRLIGYVAKFKSNEMLIVAVLGLCFGVSLLALKMGYSVALGAFIMGAVIAESKEIHRVERLVEPVRDMFSAVFFVAVGMLIDPHSLVEYAGPIAVITAAVIVGKVFSCSLGAFVAGVDGRTSLRVGMGLAQIGEFSFIMASLGQSLNVTGKFLYPIAIAVSAITTLLTPYLIRGADTLASGFRRVAPQPLLATLGLYTHWVAELGRASPRHPGLRIVRDLVGQIAVNLALIAGVFIAAAFLARNLPARFVVLPTEVGGAKTICWVVAIVVAMPLIIASARKGQALAMMLAEIAVTDAAAGARAVHIRTIIGQVMYFAGLVGLVFYLAMLSSAVLPPWPVLVVLLIFLVAAVSLLGHMFNRWYSRAKFALVEVWNQPPSPPVEEKRPLPPLLRDAELDTFVVPPGPAAGKLIRELQLRTRTGASIVALERSGRNMVNPSPDEELQPGDTVLLLGDLLQIADAKKVMTAGPGDDSALL